MGAQDIVRQNRIREAKQRRLNVLEEQAANYGLDTPPHITVEIAQLRKELELRDRIIESPIETELAQDIGQSGQFIILTQLFDQVNKGIALIGQRVDDVQERVGDVHEYLDERMNRIESGDYEYRTRERFERIAGQRANRRFIIAIGCGLFLLLIGLSVVLYFVIRAVIELQSIR